MDGCVIKQIQTNTREVVGMFVFTMEFLKPGWVCLNVFISKMLAWWEKQLCGAWGPLEANQGLQSSGLGGQLLQSHQHLYLFLSYLSLWQLLWPWANTKICISVGLASWEKIEAQRLLALFLAPHSLQLWESSFFFPQTSWLLFHSPGLRVTPVCEDSGNTMSPWHPGQ